MNKLLLSFLFFIVLNTAYAQRTQTLFDSSWKFFKADITGGEKENLDDKNWRTVLLPHDWSIEDLPNQSDSVRGPFSASSIGATATGYTIGGTAWYRKHFTLNNIPGKKVTIYFDGVYLNSEVWINEHYLGNHPYGYTAFYHDLTPYLKQNGENVLAVRVRNEGKNSRWYSGSGIYRHVWLTTTNTTHVDEWGVYITTPEVNANTASINIQTKLAADNGASLQLHTQILDGENKIVASAETPVIADKNELDQTVKIALIQPCGLPMRLTSIMQLQM